MEERLRGASFITKRASFKNYIENGVFIVLLVFYPLILINQGLDVSDTTYSLANFQYFASMDSTWMVATFLANVIGYLMMHLPLGDTLTGMYFYTALVQSVIALAVYLIMRKRIPATLVFVGEWVALGLCWCPSTVLYNYLTYLLMTVGMLLLYGGILKDNRKYYIAAGVCLGVNVAVRMPNVVHAAFIVALWYGAYVCGRTIKKTVRDTLWCILGYVVGFGVPFAAICIRYGVVAYPAMVQTMFAMTEQAVDYKPTAMMTGMFGDYAVGLFWLIFAGICMAGGWLLFAVQRRIFQDKRGAEYVCKAVYIAVLLVLLRFYWGKGVFTFQYYGERSMYYPAVLLLLVTIFAAAYCLIKKGISTEQKILAVLVLVQIFVTPLGSNNYLYPIINNLFLGVPFLLWVVKPKFFVWKAPLVLLIVFMLIQSTGFHMSYAFRDGDEGEARDTVLTMPAKAAGIYTNKDNAAWLEELVQYVQSAEISGREVILYGKLPGLGYLLDMPSALSTFWPDLDSYRMVEYERDMGQLTEPPVIIVASPVAAYLNEDADGMNRFGVDRDALDADKKLQMLADYMSEHSYCETFANGRYVVYVTE